MRTLLHEKSTSNKIFVPPLSIGIFRRLFKPTNRSEFYKNVLLWVILFGALFIVAGPLALHYSYMLPAVKSRSIPLKDFSEERARDYYPALTQYGPRVSNTLADHQTRHFLLTQIDRIRSTASKSVQFDINLQNFTVEDIDGLQNIAVRLFNANSPSNTPCLMLVAHYDSGRAAAMTMLRERPVDFIRS